MLSRKSTAVPPSYLLKQIIVPIAHGRPKTVRNKQVHWFFKSKDFRLRAMMPDDKQTALLPHKVNTPVTGGHGNKRTIASSLLSFFVLRSIESLIGCHHVCCIV